MGKHFFDYDDGNFAHTISDKWQLTLTAIC